MLPCLIKAKETYSFPTTMYILGINNAAIAERILKNHFYQFS